MSAAINILKTKMFPNIKRMVKTAFSHKYLLYTNVSISTTLSGFGDAIEQSYEILTEDIDKFDYRRNRNMSITGITIGIVCHNWYKILDRRLPGNALKQVVRKIILDQFICSPICISSFFFTIALLENEDFETFLAKVKEKSWRLYMAEWIVWPPAQFINFYFLPTRFRVMYDSTISLGYDIYTSYVINCLPDRKHCFKS